MDQARITPLNAVGEGSLLATPSTETTRRKPRLVAQMIEFPAAGTAGTSDCFHETTGLVYVLEGKLQLDCGGLQELLEPGDCAYVESDMPLAWSAAGKHRCRVLAVVPGSEAESRS
jgi:quercetin dioxygenase-like cupin family protein